MKASVCISDKTWQSSSLGITGISTDGICLRDHTLGMIGIGRPDSIITTTTQSTLLMTGFWNLDGDLFIGTEPRNEVTLLKR